MKSLDSTEAVTLVMVGLRGVSGSRAESSQGSSTEQVSRDPRYFASMSLLLFVYPSFEGGRLLSPLELALSLGSLAPGSPLTWSSFSLLL